MKKPFLNWNKFFVRKIFRGATFNINFETYDGDELEIFCDGEKIKGNLKPQLISKWHWEWPIWSF